MIEGLTDSVVSGEIPRKQNGQSQSLYDKVASDGNGKLFCAM